MTTSIYLIRHAAHSSLGRVLVGRAPNVHLSAAGWHQARDAAARLPAESLTLVETSPLERARETASVVAARYGLPVRIESRLNEANVGEWTGRTFQQLESDPAWQRWNSMRGEAVPPNGESMADLQKRILAHLADTVSAHRDGRIAIISHGEPIRAVLMHYLGIPLNDFHRIDIGPASISTIIFDRGAARVVAVNGSQNFAVAVSA